MTSRHVLIAVEAVCKDHLGNWDGFPRGQMTNKCGTRFKDRIPPLSSSNHRSSHCLINPRTTTDLRGKGSAIDDNGMTAVFVATYP